MKNELSIKKSFSCQKSELKNIRDFVHLNLVKINLNEDVINKMVLAADETCSNVFMHNDHNKKCFFDIDLKCTDKNIFISMEDKNDKTSLMEISMNELKHHIQEYKKYGLGIFLIRLLVDEIQFNSIKNKGNTFKLIKHLKTADFIK